MGRSIRMSKKKVKNEEDSGHGSEGERSDSERFNSFFGCLKGYDFNDAMNDLRELRKEEG